LAGAYEWLARHGILLTRLSAAHEAAAMDPLCSVRPARSLNALTIDGVSPMAGLSRERVLSWLYLRVRGRQDRLTARFERLRRRARRRHCSGWCVSSRRPTRMSEAFIVDRNGNESRILKGAFHAIVEVAQMPAEARHLVDELATQGQRVIAVATGSGERLHFIASLRAMGVRTVMITGDSPVTGAAIASDALRAPG
jgi:H+-transporting ATPase